MNPHSNNDRLRPQKIAPTFTRATSLGYQVNHLARLLEQTLRQRINPHGVVPGQFAQLLALYEEEPLTQRELCDRVRIEQPTMSYTLQRMERDGLVTRTPDSSGDKRQSRINLTQRAKELRGVLTSEAQAGNTLATQGLTDDEVTAFMSTMERIIRNLVQ